MILFENNGQLYRSADADSEAEADADADVGRQHAIKVMWIMSWMICSKAGLLAL
jgi:hypothetical protein